jgi:hypothetical protein
VLRRPRRAYRVYAEDGFLESEDPGTQPATAGDPQFIDVPSYTAPVRRRMPGPLGGRAGVVMVALVAMAVSALVVHALRAGLAGGGEAPRPATVPVAAAVTPVVGRTSVRASVPVRGDTLLVSRRAGRAPGALRREAGDHEHDRARRPAMRVRTGGALGGQDRFGQRSAPVLAAVSERDTGSPSTISTAAPEFGFER